MSVPTVDVILCTYNRAHLIERAIESVLAQAYTEWRLYVIDDGSSDETSQHIARLRVREPRISYLKKAHGGLARARNFGITHSSSGFITFIDSDDAYHPDHLGLRIEYVRRHPEVDLLHGGVELIGAEEDHYVRDATDSSKLIHINECCVGGTLFGKRLVFAALKGFKIIDYSSESDFLLRASERFTVVKIDFPTYRYYLQHEDRLCKVMSRERALTRGDKG